MFWDKKRDTKNPSGLPDLPDEDSPPSMRNYGDYPSYDSEQDTDFHTLPVFPNSQRHESFNQDIIKNAVENPDSEDYSDEPENPEPMSYPDRNLEMERSPKIVELKEWRPKTYSNNLEPEMPMQSYTPLPQDGKPIFVKLTKFKEARESLEVAKIKLAEIDELLRTLKEVKIKEDQELSNWEKEITAIKTRIEQVTSHIFDRNM